MKNILICIILMIMILVGCSKDQLPVADSYDAKWDYPYMFHEQGSGIGTAKSNTGYYFLVDSLIYYMDSDSQDQPIVLDNRPNNQCMNLDEISFSNCYAVVSLSNEYPRYIQFYDNHLYLLESKMDYENEKASFNAIWQLVRRDADGQNRKVVKTFDVRPRALAIHRNMLYYSTWLADQEGDSKYQLLQLDFNKLNKKPKVLYEGDEVDGAISDIIPYGNQLYLVESYSGYRALRYDLLEDTVSTLGDRDDGANVMLMSIHNDRLYLNYFYNDPGDEIARTTYTSDLKGERIKKVDAPDVPVISIFKADEKYYYNLPVSGYLEEYGDGKPFEMLISSGNKLIQSFDMSFLPNQYTMIAGDDRYLFIRYNMPSSRGMIYLDKTLLANGEAKFKKLIEEVGPTWYRTDIPDRR